VREKRARERGESESEKKKYRERERGKKTSHTQLPTQKSTYERSVQPPAAHLLPKHSR